MENINILVPLDFSDLGSKALYSAEKMAKLFNGSITPFHSYLPLNEVNSGPYMFGMEPASVGEYDNIEDTLHDRLAEIANEAVDSSLLTEPQISIGNPAQTIVEEGEKFDMIVMSTHGRTGFSRFFLGSVSEKVLRTSRVPVLIVNQERELDTLNRIMLTTDFSDNSRAAFPFAKAIAKQAGAKLELVNILAYDQQHEEQPEQSKIDLRRQRLDVLAKEQLHEISDLVETKVIVSTETPHEAILNFNLNNPHDLIVMSTVGRTGIDYLMMGSTTANVARHVKSPVLSLNPKQQTEQ
ncbi:Nucleotide-binding universal stress protein, UspA family [Fodinibius salinus]|uniref:Nucleotide-binding universal stress protein, UspA family n=1 Tax=Fodinibius salinus TaxID=860790 RepID=A0A5D3YSL0_9BACT|nr:universal stress protein [Fodinibius salinus]TYP95551.1 Nucleotide-binding universal stress protein, UspA family [Fodinibius salinus]